MHQGTTAGDGTFTLDPLPVGWYWLVVEARHFAVRQLRLDLDANPRLMVP